MRRDLEALLFAADQPLTVDRLATFFHGADKKAVREAIEELRQEYDRDEHAFTIVEFGGGYSISTRPEHAALVKKLFKGRRKQRLSRPALEALAIIAYKQPVTRLEIEEIRGVSASGVIGTLLERDLVQIVGRAETLGHPLLYGTTKNFLDHIGLRGIKELPQLSELEDLLAEKEELKQLATARGEEVGDEDFDRVLADGDEDAEEDSEEIVDAENEADDAATEPTEDVSDDAEDLDAEASEDDDAHEDEAVAEADDAVEDEAVAEADALDPEDEDEAEAERTRVEENS